jgi:excisionase family DNA binding protein
MCAPYVKGAHMQSHNDQLVTIHRGSKPTSGLLNYAEAAAYLGTSERHVRGLWQERRLTAVKVGRRVRFAKADLDAFIDRNRRPNVR